MKQNAVVLALLAVLAWFAPAVAIGTVPMTKEQATLYENLIAEMACLCGCGTTLKTCPHENCDFAIPARKEIMEMAVAGKGKDEIISKMVETRGTAVLASPTFTGFNILAWVTPFIAILLVGYLVVLLVRSWSVRKSASTVPRQAEPSEDDPYVKKLRDELKRYDD